MKIYISIPIAGHDPEEQRAKAERFNEKERYAYLMGFDIADLLRSDAAYFSRGWEQSKGCRLEHAAAEIYGLKIYYALDRIPEAE